MTPTCIYCDRRVFWLVRGEPRCLRHLFLESPPKAERIRAAIRKRRPASAVQETTTE